MRWPRRSVPSPFRALPVALFVQGQAPVLAGRDRVHQSVPDARVELKGTKKKAAAADAWAPARARCGLSGPAALRLSAFKARELQDCGYKGTLVADLARTPSPGAVPGSTLDAHKKSIGRDRRRRD